MDEIRAEAKILEIELRILWALEAYAEDAGHDQQMEMYQHFRVRTALDGLMGLVGEPAALAA